MFLYYSQSGYEQKPRKILLNTSKLSVHYTWLDYTMISIVSEEALD